MSQFESRCKDELIDLLIDVGYIRSINVEKVFRSVDQELYYDNGRNRHWQSIDVHLSSPIGYATALECLDLHEGHKFLNIGSGIGYLSTLAGLLLGINGVNHGIEIHSSLINIANQKLEVFKQNSAAIDYFEFCEPVFIKGNACELTSFGYYDRVNCGPGVPPEKSSFMKSLIKIGGVLVMPLDGVLVKVTRIGEDSWKTIDNIDGIEITDLVVEKCSSMNVLKFPTVEPLSLQELCRSNIRASIRNCFIESQPGLQMRFKCNPIISYEQKLLKDTLVGDIEVHNYLNEMRVCEDDASDLDSTSVNEVIEKDNDEDNNGDDVDVEENNTSEQCDKSLLEKTASDTKKEGSESKCFDLITIPIIESEERRIKWCEIPPNDLNFSTCGCWSKIYHDLSESHDNDDDNNGDDFDIEENNTSEQCDKSLLEKTASDTKKEGSESKRFDLITIPIIDSEERRIKLCEMSKNDKNFSTCGSWSKFFHDLSESHDNDDDNYGNDFDVEENNTSEQCDKSLLKKTASDTKKKGSEAKSSEQNKTFPEKPEKTMLNYYFLNNRRENELSKLLKVKINQLPVPAMLKVFLNYNIDDKFENWGIDNSCDDQENTHLPVPGNVSIDDNNVELITTVTRYN